MARGNKLIIFANQMQRITLKDTLLKKFSDVFSVIEVTI